MGNCRCWPRYVTAPSHDPLLTQPPAVQAADSSIYHDAETGFTFSQYLAEYEIGSSIAVRIALPSPIQNSTYDMVIQVVAPVDVGWAGIAWAGQMMLCPLTVAWANGNSVTVSSRYAT